MERNGGEWNGMKGNRGEWSGIEGGGEEWRGMKGDGEEWRGMEGEGVEEFDTKISGSTLKQDKKFCSTKFQITQRISTAKISTWFYQREEKFLHRSNLSTATAAPTPFPHVKRLPEPNTPNVKRWSGTRQNFPVRIPMRPNCYFVCQLCFFRFQLQY